MSSAASYTGGSTGTHGDFVPDTGFIEERLELYEAIVEGAPTARCKEASSAERETLGLLGQASLAYSELPFEPLALALQKIRDLYGGLELPGQCFYDLGSGGGQAVIAASLLHSAWARCAGIEVLRSLHAVSLELLAELQAPATQERLPAEVRGTPVDFLRGDFTALNWSDADVIVACSTCYDEALMRSIASLADELKVGSFAITCTKPLPSYKWIVLESVVEQMSWGGPATVFILKKVI